MAGKMSTTYSDGRESGVGRQGWGVVVVVKDAFPTNSADRFKT